jgi:5-methylcytosine-specific restriction enzyme A
MNRVRFSQRAKEGVITDQSGMCPLCDGELSGAIEWDHVIPLALGGADEIENIQAVHAVCHLHLKTKADVKRIAKAKRQALEAGPQKRLRERKAAGLGSRLSGPGFDKTKTRGFDGKVRARNAGVNHE